MTASSRLVDQRFERTLTPREQKKLEGVLSSSPVALERYRKLHLLERVTALGPDRALEEPSPAEIERIAHDLGLVEAPAAPFDWRRWLPWGGASMMLAAAAAVMLVFLPNPPEVNERGTASAVSIGAYVITPAGVVRSANATTATADDALKFRVTLAEPAQTIGVVQVRMVDAAGEVHELVLEPGDFDSSTVTVPGAVGLQDLPPGVLRVTVTVSPADGPPTVESFELMIGGPAP